MSLTGHVTEDWLKEQKFEVSRDLIDGVIVKELKSIIDGRGDVIELWSLPWVENENLMVPKHCYQSATDYGVTKCWHLHEIHIDQFTVTRGKLQVVMVDTRKDSPTFGKVNSIILGTGQPRLIKIPNGIMHGWKALSRPEVIVVNFQTEVYDPGDELKFTWDCIIPEVWEPKNG
ncbi:MAG: dTDP-4-dehydrorhamnose 3,5-epimerase family protein [bacterium]|nr:dTDP-4-dehydrorhamnose 3,5-epimerase family protein [bacterium]